MEVKISNEYLDSDNIDLQFIQPKYYFGQLLIYGKDKFGKEKSGIVIQMAFNGDRWEYVLFNLETTGLTEWRSEETLMPAVASVGSI